MASWTVEQRLKRLMLFRVVMMTTLLLIAIYVETVSETLRVVNPLYYLIAATYGLTLLYVLALRFLGQLEAQIHVQVFVDVLVVTGLVYVGGGAGTRGGFLLLYPVSVLSGSAFLGRRGAILLSVLASVLYAGILWAVRMELVPPQGLSEVLLANGRSIVYSVFVTAVACGTAGLIGAGFSERLRTVGEQLEEAAGQVADLQEFNKIIVDSIHSGLLTVDAGGQIVYVNEYGASILGCSPAQLRGHTLKEIFGSRSVEGPALQARAANENLARLELVYRRPDGDVVDLGVSVTALATDKVGAGGQLFVFQDLTEIKRLQQEVSTKEKLAAVGEMAAQLAHEIRNPLGSISGSAQVLLGEAEISVEQGHLLAIITRESKRLSDTLNQFLFQIRPSTRSRGPVDLGPVISEAVTLLRNGPEVGPHHKVTFEAQPGPHLCLADPDQITQVFWNLVRNGLEAMPDGGTLHVHLGSREDEVVFLVRDQGRGMAREDQHRVFEPFHSQRPMGTGLGLAIVYRIVREHRGDITVRSVPNQGTEVEVRLPLVPLPVPA